jgi:hypothetical protein
VQRGGGRVFRGAGGPSGQLEHLRGGGLGAVGEDDVVSEDVRNSSSTRLAQFPASAAAVGPAFLFLPADLAEGVLQEWH